MHSTVQSRMAGANVARVMKGGDDREDRLTRFANHSRNRMIVSATHLMRIFLDSYYPSSRGDKLQGCTPKNGS